MSPDDVVVYTRSHYEWLINASQWVGVKIHRESYRGRVVSADHDLGVVEVRWPDKDESTKHFIDNIERVIP